MAKTKPARNCAYCAAEIVRTRTPEGVPKFMWKSANGFYCVKVGGDCQHYPEDLKEATND